VAVYGLNIGSVGVNGSVCSWQGRWRPTPGLCAAGAGSVTTVKICAGGRAPAAMLSTRYPL
jgi:hypothetical protein